MTSSTLQHPSSLAPAHPTATSSVAPSPLSSAPKKHSASNAVHHVLGGSLKASFLPSHASHASKQQQQQQQQHQSLPSAQRQRPAAPPSALSNDAAETHATYPPNDNPTNSSSPPPPTAAVKSAAATNGAAPSSAATAANPALDSTSPIAKSESTPPEASIHPPQHTPAPANHSSLVPHPHKHDVPSFGGRPKKALSNFFRKLANLKLLASGGYGDRHKQPHNPYPLSGKLVPVNQNQQHHPYQHHPYDQDYHRHRSLRTASSPSLSISRSLETDLVLLGDEDDVSSVQRRRSDYQSSHADKNSFRGRRKSSRRVGRRSGTVNQQNEEDDDGSGDDDDMQSRSSFGGRSSLIAIPPSIRTRAAHDTDSDTIRSTTASSHLGGIIGSQFGSHVNNNTANSSPVVVTESTAVHGSGSAATSQDSPGMMMDDRVRNYSALGNNSSNVDGTHQMDQSNSASPSTSGSVQNIASTLGTVPASLGAPSNHHPSTSATSNGFTYHGGRPASVITGTTTTSATTRTLGGGFDGRRDIDSTFSSGQSVRSFATTLTTMQSIMTMPGGAATGGPPSIHFPPQTSFPASPSTHYGSGTFPYYPHHVFHHPQQSSIGLTDDASVITLASSSKQRRSFDTNASMRGLAPSSVGGGSRESLPLSVLSANTSNLEATTPGGAGTGLSRLAAERTSIYSAATSQNNLNAPVSTMTNINGGQPGPTGLTSTTSSGQIGTLSSAATSPLSPPPSGVAAPESV